MIRALRRITLTEEGRRKLERQQALSPKDPVELSRDELISELKRRYGFSDEQLVLNPKLRYERFTYLPSVGAYRPKFKR
jgi:hypothetical protein